jgi:Asp-tRNA(Asn)/Glu-tRNA(Gln) amidotransferase A subunit family amidase
MFRDLSIRDINIKMQSKELDPLDLVEESIARNAKLGSTYKPFRCFDEDVLRRQAEVTRSKLSDEQSLKPLECIPVGVKDIFNSCDYPTEMGSPLWKGFTPGNDARAVYNLKNNGAVVAGKTVTAEFAVHALNETLNPHNIELTPGTSSSGSAVSVALGIVPVSIGTQTAGSIIRPASFCGVYGCKPSFGLIPRTAMLKTTDSLDSVGFFSYFSEDLRSVFDACRVHGPNFPISYKALGDPSRQIKPKSRPWRVAFVRNDCWENTPEYAKTEMNAFVRRLSRFQDIQLLEVQLPTEMEAARDTHKTIYNKSLSYYFSKEYEKKDFISSVMVGLLEDGQKITFQEYHSALAQQSSLINKIDGFMQDYDVMLSLSTSGQAPLRVQEELPDSALMWTLTHLPVVSAPVFQSPDGMPFGLQITARKYNDILLFNFVDFLREANLIPKACNPVLGF